MLLKKLSEEDFAVLRGALESGRQSPNALAPMLVLSIFLQALMFILTYVVAADATIFPYKESILIIHLIITGTLILLSGVYAMPKLYTSLKGQKIQYIVVILVSQNLFGMFLYISALFIVGEGDLITEETLLTSTFITLFIGLLIFMATCVRFYILLQRGEYKKGSKKDEIRTKAEFNIKPFLPMIIIGSTGIVYIIQFVIRNSNSIDIESIGIIVLGVSLFYAMLFVLPEQLVILYCKYRFDSFNYNKNWKLKPMGREGV
ncbi:hypothetical protein QGM71_16950 [Virgibacillus sp. C22-A2]|uniref:ABC transporter ATPase n=1 Tax=Virgibacillus tibetensis TaxID=3042313 RepID=A0ABU6KJA2_9BACI|nr:hypothetical protein [Virgibacillus sp. C22-A2]